MMGSDSTIDRSEDDPALNGFFSPKRAAYRFIGLALMCLMGFGKSNINNYTDVFLQKFLFFPVSCYILWPHFFCDLSFDNNHQDKINYFYFILNIIWYYLHNFLKQNILIY